LTLFFGHLENLTKFLWGEREKNCPEKFFRIGGTGVSPVPLYGGHRPPYG
jgi:hypothetical protein